MVRLPDVDACIRHIREREYGLFVVDPFIETHESDENSNKEIRAVGALFRDIAHQAECAVLLVHHTGKPPQGSSDGHAGNVNTARGASALVGVARIVQTLFSMSPRDAQRYDVKDEDRRLFVRLDDGKVNPALVSGEPRWYRRTGVVIANGDDVGVLIPEDLGTPEDEDEGADGIHRTIVGCLLARVPGPEITLNAAAKLLAWSGDERFAKYRQTNPKGHQRVNESLRRAILAACRSNVCIVSDGRSRGFTCNEHSSPVTLRRFDHPASAVDLASQPTEFEEDA